MRPASHRVDAMQVLVVDDFDDAREMYASFLRRAGWIVVEAASAQEAIERATRSLPDIVLMDLALPDFDGLEATRRLKRAQATSRIPVLVLTACVDDTSRTRAFAAGAEGVITKPCLPSDLVRELERHLDRASVRARLDELHHRAC